MAVFSSSPWGGTAISTTKWKKYVSKTDIPSSSLATSMNVFPRISGYMILKLINTSTGDFWSVDIIGGMQSITGGYENPPATPVVPPIVNDQRGAYRYVNGTQINMTSISSVRVYPLTTITVTDLSGNVFQLIFSQFATITPTIQMTSGTPFDAELDITYIRTEMK